MGECIVSNFSFILSSVSQASWNPIIQAHKTFMCCILVFYTGSFAGLGFIAWYLSGKIRAFDRKGHIAKLCVVFLPILIAALVGVSRVDDYWHHWQDVFAGGLIGIAFFLKKLCKYQFKLTFVFKKIFFVEVPYSSIFYAGITVASFCYLQFFPPPYDTDGMSIVAVFLTNLDYYILYCDWLYVQVVILLKEINWKTI